MALTVAHRESVPRAGIKGPSGDEDSGAPHVIDAYCAHLVAHMGVGAGAPESHVPGLYPVLVKGDGPIMEFRRWAGQFYTWPDDEAPRWARPEPVVTTRRSTDQ
jgi:hypothetical protein